MWSSGITISGLEEPLVIRQPATISCMTDLPVTSIKWRNHTSQLSANTSDAADVTVLSYTIPPVSERMRGQTLTCVVITSDQTYYSRAIEVQIKGTCYF